MAKKPTKAPKSPKKKSAPLTPQQKVQRRQIRIIQSFFEGAGFTRVAGVADQHFQFLKAKTEFDDCFVWKNVIVFAEYTVEKDVSGHYKKKAYNYQEFIDHADEFIDFIWEKYPELAATKAYHKSQIEIRFVYCPISEVSADLLDRMKHVSVVDELNRAYFSSLVKTVRKSAINELMEFLGVPFDRAGDAVTSAAGSTLTLPAQFIPSSASYLGSDHVVVSFYSRPADLLKMAYVLRKQGWRDQDYLFQRMIDKKKIDSVRDHLLASKRVFLNNIIVALPEDTILRSLDKNVLDLKKFAKLTDGTIELPQKFNCIGIIDGQHRVFSYHEGGKQDEEMNILRQRQDLLVTGVVFPPGLTDAERLKTQAEIFLEINSKQTSANSELIQELLVVISPYSEISIARQVLNRLNTNGALAGKFARSAGDVGRLKTSSVVSYGLRQLLKFDGSDTLFKSWVNSEKLVLKNGGKGAPLEQYLAHSSATISTVFSAVKVNIQGKWDTTRNDEAGVLSTTFVNGILVLMRRMAEAGVVFEFDAMKDQFSKLSTFDFSPFKSSQYGEMGKQLFVLLYPQLAVSQPA